MQKTTRPSCNSLKPSTLSKGLSVRYIFPTVFHLVFTETGYPINRI